VAQPLLNYGIIYATRRWKELSRIKKERANISDTKDLFSFFEGYLKETIEEDLRHIYKDEARLISSEEPWIFQLEK